MCGLTTAQCMGGPHQGRRWRPAWHQLSEAGRWAAALSAFEALRRRGGERSSSGILIRAATSTVTTKINEIRHGSPFSAESPTEVRFVTVILALRAKIGVTNRTSVGDSAENDDP